MCFKMKLAVSSLIRTYLTPQTKNITAVQLRISLLLNSTSAIEEHSAVEDLPSSQ